VSEKKSNLLLRLLRPYKATAITVAIIVVGMYAVFVVASGSWWEALRGVPLAAAFALVGLTLRRWLDEKEHRKR
jgi:hypothetical protein